jgi:hypothetical protein
MLYGDRGYCIAHAHSRTKEPLGRVSRSGAGDDQGKKEDYDAPERFGVSNAGRGVSAVRTRRLRRAT